MDAALPVGNARMFRSKQLAVLLACLALAAAPAASAAEVMKLSATASWRGLGQVFDLGHDQVLVVGDFAGTIFIDGGGRPHRGPHRSRRKR